MITAITTIIILTAATITMITAITIIIRLLQYSQCYNAQSIGEWSLQAVCVPAKFYGTSVDSQETETERKRSEKRQKHPAEKMSPGKDEFLF